LSAGSAQRVSAGHALRAVRRAGAGHALRAARPALRGGVPLALPAIAMVLVLGAGIALLLRSAEEAGVGRVDATRVRLHSGDGWVPSDWRQRLDSLLLEVDALELQDRGALEAFEEQLRALPFVAEVASVEVRHPASLRVELRFHEPAACIRLGREFLPVACDGTLLPGWSEVPHEVDGAPLPVLRPVPKAWDEEPPFYGCLLQVACPDECPRHHEHLEPADAAPDAATEGDGGSSLGCTAEDCAVRRLEERADRAARGVPPSGAFLSATPELQRLEAALSLATSLRAAPLRTRRGLGRVVLDATEAAAPDGSTGGTVLLLDQRRIILWGRTPLEASAPGARVAELSEAAKWSAISDALEDLEAGREWDALDVRFDTPVREREGQ
jgi:hypothetical protein